jgi:hypothetical protein
MFSEKVSGASDEHGNCSARSSFVVLGSARDSSQNSELRFLVVERKPYEAMLLFRLVDGLAQRSHSPRKAGAELAARAVNRG